MKPGLTGFAHLRAACGYSVKGLRAAFGGEAAFRQELFMLAAGTALAIWLPLTWVERTALVAVIGLVIVVELLNSAIEAIVDLASPDFHPLAGRAKDMGSAAVMVALVMAGIVWLGVTARLWL